MRTPIEALKEIRDRLTYFCLRTDGKYDPPWATELVGIIDDILKYKKNTDNPFYVDIGTSVVAIRCSSNHDVVHRLDHAHSTGSIDYLKQMCARMNEEALGLQKQVNAAAMREALEFCIQQMDDAICDKDFGDDVVYLVGCMKTCIDYMKHTLSAPPRNCDVGTAEEQYERFEAFCAKHRQDNGPGSHCMKCPINEWNRSNRFCQFAWAQMPYESEAKE